MIYAVFLCDAKWKIDTIRQCNAALSLNEGEWLTDLVLESDGLQNSAEDHYSLELTFKKEKMTLPAVIDRFKEGNLVILAQVRNNHEFLELNNEYSQYLDWAKDHFLGLYHDEYFLIQQMNNQLVDAQRRLTRSNRQLEHALQENKEINEKLEKARRYAERANLSKTRFLANMSHDIRTPMNAIIGLTELMQYHFGEPEVLKRYISKLKSSGQYLLDLLNDILDLSKIENGSMELKIEPMDVGTQIEQIVTIIRPQMSEKKQKLSVQCDCPEFCTVLGDPVRLRQILMNLFSNAVKYTPEGGNIRFIIRENIKTEQKCGYQFVVEDDGIGMTEDFRKHIFDPFTRAEAEVGKIQGTGLGMAITKSIIDAMGGRISVESTPGKGSRFYVDISFEICKEQNVPKNAEKILPEKSEDGLENLEGMRFLCAEDNELNAEILTSMLELEGAECTIYQNGKLLIEAFEKTQPGEYDAILMDVQMPVMNGYEATKKIRNSNNVLGKKIPIIAMTANAFSEDVEQCIEAGMDAHIAKPIDITVLKKHLHHFI